ncbi:dethiobiotin synthase [Cyanobacterium sp. Dongsha4]|uniref:dethiobiotin synthase n=1 Tax=Cyanobacterium sp. DS4 TaxID=2878255 RepID=UPI002E80E86E|nr:dethiobiotin synthase [Cyanobacterium sp. Dongsha4]WVL02305.1 dethiobiotin synthase [Cyanobacterium sp. Dongsha4]
MQTLLIAGTDTDAGKTIITTAFRAYLQRKKSHLATALMKLLQTGEIGDEEFYGQYFDDAVIPLRYQAPLAPPLAAKLEGKSIDLAIVKNRLLDLQKSYDFILVEALGGLGSPITEKLIIADIAYDWLLDTILIVPVKLGAIAHTVANVALAKQYNIKLAGIIFNCVQDYTPTQINQWTPKGLIESLTGIPVLGYFPYLGDVNCLNLDELANISEPIFSQLIN